MNCEYCGKVITGTGKKFCSVVCSSKKNHKYPIEDILNGKYPKYQSSKLRKRLLSEGYKEYICEICGTKE